MACIFSPVNNILITRGNLFRIRSIFSFINREFPRFRVYFVGVFVFVLLLHFLTANVCMNLEIKTSGEKSAEINPLTNMYHIIMY